MSSFTELFKANLRIVFRNHAGLFWVILLPLILYVALSLLPINRFIQVGTDYAKYLLPGFIALTVMQGGIYGLAYWLVELRARGAVERFVVTPIKAYELVLSVISARVVVMIIQAILLTILGAYFFGASIPSNIFYAFIFIIAGGFIFLLLGLFISTFGDSYETTAPITAAVGLPFAFLSSVFYPVSTLHIVLQKIASFLPITHLADGLRKIYLNSPTFLDIVRDLSILILWAFFMLLLAMWRLKYQKNR